MKKQGTIVRLGFPPLVIQFDGEDLRDFWAGFRDGTRRRFKIWAAPIDFKRLFRPYSEKEALAVLKALYFHYFERELDDTGRNVYLPRIQSFGYSGIVSVSQELMQSGEMNEKVGRNLHELYQKYLHREPDETGRAEYDKWIRFFGARGRQHVEKMMSKSEERAQVKARQENG